MREMSSATKDLLAKRVGIEGVFLIKVIWQEQGTEFWYADKTIADNYGNVLYPGKIIEFSNFDNTVSIDGNTTSAFATMTLDDSDGKLKLIFDQVNLLKRPITVYQTFQHDGQLTDKFPLIQGVTVGPVTWSEGDRTVTFGISTRLESYEMGFSAEHLMGPISQSLIGTPWPMVFGHVYHTPALKLQEVPQGFTTDSIIMATNNLQDQIAYLGNLHGQYVQRQHWCEYWAAIAGLSAAASSPGGNTTDIPYKIAELQRQQPYIYIEWDSSQAAWVQHEYSIHSDPGGSSSGPDIQQFESDQKAYEQMAME